MAKVSAEVMAKSAGSYAKQIRDAGRSAGIEAVVILVSKRDGRAHWGSTLSANNAGEVLKAVARQLGHSDSGLVVVDASALPRS